MDRLSHKYYHEKNSWWDYDWNDKWAKKQTKKYKKVERFKHLKNYE